MGLAKDGVVFRATNTLNIYWLVEMLESLVKKVKKKLKKTYVFDRKILYILLIKRYFPPGRCKIIQRTSTLKKNIKKDISEICVIVLLHVLLFPDTKFEL